MHKLQTMCAPSWGKIRWHSAFLFSSYCKKCKGRVRAISCVFVGYFTVWNDLWMSTLLSSKDCEVAFGENTSVSGVLLRPKSLCCCPLIQCQWVRSKNKVSLNRNIYLFNKNGVGRRSMDKLRKCEEHRSLTLQLVPLGAVSQCCWKDTTTCDLNSSCCCNNFQEIIFLE